MIRVVSSDPACVIEPPLARKEAGNHLIKFNSLEKTQSLVSGFFNARNQVCNAAVKRNSAISEFFNLADDFMQQ